MNEVPFGEKSMLFMLFDKLADVLKAENGKRGSAAEQEVWRQIKQITGDIVKGENITKSGEED